jgi:universal stress protein E
MNLSRILVDVDATAADHPALSSAVELAARCHATVTIVDVIPDVPRLARRFLSTQVEQELTMHRRARLAEMAEDISVVPTRSAVLRGRPATALVEEVRRSGQDLLVRSHVRDLAAASRAFGGVDMELLRHCPCPVWLIGPAPPERPRRILAAVHSASDQPSEQALNRTIVEAALLLRDLEGGHLTVVEAWSFFGEELLRPRLAEEGIARALEETRREVEAGLRALVASFGEAARDVAIEIVKGHPGQAIPAIVESLDIDVVVMGTVARTGVAGLLMGNTAEEVLQRLRGSVLAVKPPRFVCPVPAPDRDPWVSGPPRG